MRDGRGDARPRVVLLLNGMVPGERPDVACAGALGRSGSLNLFERGVVAASDQRPRAVSEE